MRSHNEDQYDKYIVISFIGETKISAIEDEEIEETEIKGFEEDEQSLYCGNVIHDQLIQVSKPFLSKLLCLMLLVVLLLP